MSTGELRATRHYEDCSAHGGSPDTDPVFQAADAMRDELLARIAELEAENERLRCCGNCGHYSRIAMTATYRCNEDKRMPGQHSRMPWSDCRFIPNKWTMREEATNAAD